MKTSRFRKRRSARRRLGGIERDVLEELTFGDLLYSMALSGRSTRRMQMLARERATYRYRRKLAIQRLAELDYIEKQGERLSITVSGRTMFGETADKTRRLLGTVTWDHMWRIVAFDIPEKYTKLRDKVRDILKRAGFVKLQHSIWIFPHECEELVQLIKEESRLSKYILYGVLKRIEDEERLRKVFQL